MNNSFLKMLPKRLIYVITEPSLIESWFFKNHIKKVFIGEKIDIIPDRSFKLIRINHIKKLNW